jgi:hypothetical protein
MEVSSLTFAGGRSNPLPPVLSARAGGPGTVYAPSVTLPLRFIVAGLLALGLGVGWVAVRPELLTVYHYGDEVVAWTHLMLLGWVVTVIMGAGYQLVPVALETRLFSERMGRGQFWVHLAGWIGMVWMFREWNMGGVLVCGMIFGLGACLFAVNLGLTLRRAPGGGLVRVGVGSALGWLVLTVLAGLLMAADKRWGFSPFAPMSQMHAHAHLGGGGFLLLMIMGISYKLVPMFVLGEVRHPRRAWWSLGLINAGLAGLFATVLTGHPLKLGFAAVMSAGIGLYLAEMAAILRGRKRIRLDWGVRAFLLGIGFLGPVCLLGLLLNWPGLPASGVMLPLENLYGFLVIFGVVTLGMTGMLYKIVPFLTWVACYSKLVGRGPVPALAALYSARLQGAGCWLFLAGLGGVSVGIVLERAWVVQGFWVLMVVSVGILGVNMGMVLRHYLRPKVSEPATVLARPNA